MAQILRLETEAKASFWGISEVQMHSYGNTKDIGYAHRTLVRHGLRPGSRILDVPCGKGRFDHLLRRNGFETIGLDIERRFLEFARERSRRGEADYFGGDMRRLPFADGSFNAVLNLYDSHCYFDDATNLEVLRGFARVLAPGGLLLVQGRNFGSRALRPIPKGRAAVEWVADGMYKITTVEINDGNWILEQMLLRTAMHKEQEEAFSVGELFAPTTQVISTKRFAWRAYTAKAFTGMLRKAGLGVVGKYKDQSFEPLKEEIDMSMMLVAKKE